MNRALQLAKNGIGTVSPNPMVGCVIVHDSRIIGEGWHHKFGEPHAEVNAINSVEDKSLLFDSTVYVTLEPCSFHGKTPACSDLLIRSKVKEVVVGSLDPNPKVSGNGLKALRTAGIAVEAGVLEKESLELNKRFLINQILKRPFIILKWAQTKDGFVARKNHDSKWISNELSRQIVHQWRSEEDAILVGKNTAFYDNPSLTVRDWEGQNPLRVLLDRNLELNRGLNLFNGPAQTLVYNLKENGINENYELIKLENKDFLAQVLGDLLKRDIGSIIIEGGSQVLNSFIQNNLWDEARVFTSERLFEEGIEAPKLSVEKRIVEEIDNDELSYFFNSKTETHWQRN